ncbi:aspartate/glutamate racemase family protein [Simiduia aestuariiviva]|uniref:Aspartate racemase n=1 Tax=Simiduia aestuariiviva TaxID=1510459 RepID=A0A839UKN6_9GAMM|nr:aspartate/glutamate racemase family protein [Simiduia aestuariiviva]MBB3167331.1 aspartate racemase [Simiduia aestuariiviva]
MKKIGLIGGMSWESTERYYRALNTAVKAQLGQHHSARILLDSLDFQPIKDWQFNGNWQACAETLAASAKNLQRGGADMVLICTNTMHKVAAEVAAAVDIPLVHLADATARALVNDGHRTVGFLGTQFSMEDDFYVGRLREQFNLKVLLPNAQDRALVHRVIYDELCLGTIEDASRQAFVRIMGNLHDQGATAIVEGCTEIAMLVEPRHVHIPLYDTTDIHVREAVRLAIDH